MPYFMDRACDIHSYVTVYIISPLPNQDEWDHQTYALSNTNKSRLCANQKHQQGRKGLGTEGGRNFTLAPFFRMFCRSGRCCLLRSRIDLMSRLLALPHKSNAHICKTLLRSWSQ